MPELRLDHSDAIELAELLTFLADWLSGTHNHTLTDSLATFVGHTAYNTNQLHSDLHRFVFLLGINDGEHLFEEPHSDQQNRTDTTQT
jgi:hypothetical protein